MINTDFLLSLSGFCFLVCAMPQLIRNWRFKDTITQSLLTNGFILFGNSLSLLAYIQLGIYMASMFIIMELLITVALIIQIIIWRNNREKKRIIEQTEGVRSVVARMKGLK